MGRSGTGKVPFIFSTLKCPSYYRRSGPSFPGKRFSRQPALITRTYLGTYLPGFFLLLYILLIVWKYLAEILAFKLDYAQGSSCLYILRINGTNEKIKERLK